MCPGMSLSSINRVLVVPCPNHPRKESHLSRHQTRQFSDRKTKYQSCQCYPCCRLWYGKTIQRSQNQTAYSIPWTKIIVRNRQIHEYQHPFGEGTIQERWSWGTWACLYVFPTRWSSMARTQSCDQQTEIREDWREETDHSNQGFVWRISRYICFWPYYTQLTFVTEELNKYLSYVRNLGFEDTPDYDYLRDLFTQALKSTGESEDGDYDWMKLNNGKGWEAMKAHPANYLTAAQHAPNSSAKALGGGVDTGRGAGVATPGLSTARLYAAQPPPPSPGKPPVSKTRDRQGVLGSAQQKRQSALGVLSGDVGTPTASTQAQFQNSAANLPHRLSHAQVPTMVQRQQQGDGQQQPTAMQKFLRAICCSRW